MNSIHVTPHKDGGWQVKGAGNSRASKRCETQREGIGYATKQAKQKKSELYIHGRDGKIREKNSYGNDPFPPKG